jgi:hypothetical protein
MNIIFADKLSATCWHHTSTADPTDYLDHWMLRFMHGGWCDRDNDHPQDLPVRGLFSNQHGVMGVLVIGVDTSSIERVDDCLIAGEFSWAVYGVPVDNYGQVQGNILNYCNKDTRLVVGGLINHNTNEAPEWSSHT